MSEQEMNSYRFTSGAEPSDEMLEQIMREAAADARASNARASKEYFDDLRRLSACKESEWLPRLKSIINGDA